MVFSLSGPREALDDETGIQVKSLGARGPEIESHHWRANTGEFSFKFLTHVGNDDDELNGRRRVSLWPSAELITYLKDGPGDVVHRKALVDRMIEGIYFLFPSCNFRGPIFFSKEPALLAGARVVGTQIRFETIDASGLWDVERGTRKRA